MAHGKMTLARFSHAINQFHALDTGTQVLCRYVPDPPGEVLLTGYLMRFDPDSPELLNSFVLWSIPEDAGQHSDTMLLRTLLSLIDEPSAPLSDQASLLDMIANGLTQQQPSLLVISGWSHLLTAKRGVVSRRLTSLIAELLQAGLPPIHVLAIDNQTVLDRIFATNEHLAALFQPLEVPQLDKETATAEEDPMDHLVNSLVDHDRQHVGEPGNDDIHQMIHQAMQAVETGQHDDAEKILADAENLAQQRGAQGWLAQVAYTRGVMLDRMIRPREAIPYLEQGLHLFSDTGLTRMACHTSVFLGNTLAKTGEAARALKVLQHALATAESATDFEEHERAHLQFALYRELGTAYRILGQIDTAIATYLRAFEVKPPVTDAFDIRSIDRLVLQTFIGSGHLDQGIAFGERLLAENPSADQPDDWSYLVEVQFEMGLAYSNVGDSQAAIEANNQAIEYFHQLRQLPVIHRGCARDAAMLGRLYVNTGTAYSEETRYATSLAYWRRGLDILDANRAEDASVPRDCITGLRAACPDAATYEMLLQSSEVVYQRLPSPVS